MCYLVWIMNFKFCFSLAILLHLVIAFLFLETITVNVKKENYLPVYLSDKLFVKEKNLGNHLKNETGQRNYAAKNFITKQDGYSKNIAVRSSMEAAGDNQKTLDRLRLLLHRKIQSALVYPAAAKLLGQNGTVTVKFFLHKNGFIEDIKILKSSGYSTLDKAAIETVRKISPLTIDENLLQQDAYFEIVIDFY